MTRPALYRGPGAPVATAGNGAVASSQLVAQTRVLEQRLYKVGDKIWSAVGHGMANSIMIEAPDGLIIIDTGEGIEEAGEQLALFRTVSRAPVRAVIYSHSHYVHGTKVWQDEAGGGLQVWGHARIRTNLADTGAEIGPAYIRRLMSQFSYHLPEQGRTPCPTRARGSRFFTAAGPRPPGMSRSPTRCPRTRPCALPARRCAWCRRRPIRTTR
ncbi:MAG: MBL fold metallo-hydrolase [Burkholderiaceae bacterium]